MQGNDSGEGQVSLSFCVPDRGVTFFCVFLYDFYIANKGGLFVADWKRIKAEYIAGGISQEMLAKKHKVSYHTLRKRAAAEKWTELRAEKEQIVAEEIARACAKSQANQALRIENAADKTLALVEKALLEIEQGRAPADAKTLQRLAGTIRSLRDIRAPKSELDLEEQRARIEMLKHRATSDTQDTSLQVVIVGGTADDAEDLTG